LALQRTAVAMASKNFAAYLEITTLKAGKKAGFTMQQTAPVPTGPIE